MKIDERVAPSVAADYSRRPAYIDVNVDPHGFGSSVAAAQMREAEGAEQLANVIQKHQIVRQGMFNETVAKDADVAASTELLDLQFDPKDGFMTKKGRNAVDAYKGVQEAATEIRTKYLDSMPNEDAKKMFDSVFLKRLQYSMEGLASHASRENLTWMKDTSVARQANIASEGVLNWNNLKRFNDVTIPGIVGEVTSRMEMEGFHAGDPKTTLEIQTAIDAAHVQRLKTMINFDPKGAIRELGEIDPQLSGSGKLHAEEVVLHGIRLAHEEENWEWQRKEREKHQNDEQIGQAFFTKFKNGALTPRAIDESTLSTPQKAHWWSMVEMQSRRDNALEKSSPAVQAEVLRRVGLPYGNADKITDPQEVLPFIGHGITLGQAEAFQGLIRAARTPEGQRLADDRNRAFANFKQEFTGESGSIRDIEGGRSYMEFQQAVIAKEKELQNRKDKPDPHQIYERDNPEYVGKIADRFKKTLAQRLQTLTDSIRGSKDGATLGGAETVKRPLPPEMSRQPGESMDQWLRRTSGH